MLMIKNATKTFNKNTVNEKIALEKVNLTLEKGDFVTIVGSNGAGKSTLFNLVAGSFLLDEGAIYLEDTNITFLPQHQRAKLIGRIFQDPLKGTAPSMTIEENLALAFFRNSKIKFHIGIGKNNKAFFRESLAELNLGLEDRMQTKMGLLSGGQRQAVTLLMSTLVTPKLLLLDEHTAALDPATAEKVLAITKKIVKENQLTTMMITHNIQDALALGNRTLMMDSGKIILDIKGSEREDMTTDELLLLFKKESNKTFDNDRVLLVK